MANMFPDIPTDVPAQTAESIGRVPAFDNASERFLLLDGALVERSGRAAVQQWFDLMLRQQIDRVPIYTTDGETKLGIDRSLLGQHLPNALAAAEIARNVRETASFRPAVRTIRDLTVTRRGRACHVEFTAVLYDGETVEVTTDV